MNIEIKITPGEWLDRFTILQVKLANIKDEEKVQALARRIQNEWPSLEEWHFELVADIFKAMPQMLAVHTQLWNLENQVRVVNADHPDLLMWYPEITQLNDKRAKLKARLDVGCSGADVKEHDDGN
jgi:hypothetical protein